MSQGFRPLLFVSILVSLLVLRQLGEAFHLYHFQPYLAMFFALAALRKWTWLAIPAAGYLISTLIAVGGFQAWMLSPLAAFALVVLWGKCFSRKNSFPVLLGGSLAGAGIFYLVTNTISWLTEPLYAKSLTGFTQALWTGLPGLPPTWSFFRSDATSTVLFTAIILILSRFTLREETSNSKNGQLVAAQ